MYGLRPELVTPGEPVAHQAGWAFFSTGGQPLLKVGCRDGQWTLIDVATKQVRWSGVAWDPRSRQARFVAKIDGSLVFTRGSASAARSSEANPHSQTFDPTLSFELQVHAQAQQAHTTRVAGSALLMAAARGEEKVDVTFE